MKAPREHRPHTPAMSDPQRRPSGTAQRRVDDSARQRETGARDGGLPAQLRSGLEALSGLDMSDVRVHRNSSKPAQLEAAAYAQGRDIHLSPGQEHHLPHEAWHVVQQRQGRVRANTDVAGVPVNDHPALEREADTMGRKATQRSPTIQYPQTNTRYGSPTAVQRQPDGDSDSGEDKIKRNQRKNAENRLRAARQHATKKDSSGHGTGKTIAKGNSSDKHQRGQDRKTTRTQILQDAVEEAEAEVLDLGGSTKLKSANRLKKEAQQEKKAERKRKIKEDKR